MNQSPVMRILAVTNIYPSPPLPGCGVFVREQVRGLRAIGLEVRVRFVDRRQDGPLAYFRMNHQVACDIADFDPHVVHVMYGGVMADQIVRHHGTRPVVVTFHGSDLLGENLSGWTRKIISRYGMHCSRSAARRADAVIVVAQHLVRALRGAAAPGKIRVVPCGIDLDRFKPMDSRECRRKLGWSARSFHVLFASSNGDPVKRPQLAKGAVERMASGPAPQLHHLTGVPNEDVPAWLNAGDALLLTSMHEGSPTIVKEALACGLPVVSVDVGDVAERIAGIEGCHLAPARAEDLAAKLDLVRRRGTRLDPSLAGRREELSRQSAARALKRCYEDIQGRREGAPGIGSTSRSSLPEISDRLTA